MTRKPNFILFLLIILTFVLIACEQSQAYQTSTQTISAKEELQQLLQKSSNIDNIDVTYSMKMTVLDKALIDITTRQAKQGNKQRLEASGTMLGFPMNTRSIIIDGQQTTCGLFENGWKCAQGKEVCQEIAGKGRQCLSVSEEGFPTIKPEQLENADVTKAGTKQLLGMNLQCYNLKIKQSGQEGSIEACVNQDGLILLLQSETKGAQLKIEAKSYSTTIAPNEFEMPTA